MKNKYLIVLGFKMNNSYKESIIKENKTLMSRLYTCKNILETSKQQHIVITCGKGKQKVTESAFMKDFLQQHVNTKYPLKIIEENNSMTTLENLFFVWPLIFLNEQYEINEKVDIDIQIVTSSFHIRRSVYLLKMIYDDMKMLYKNVHVDSLENIDFNNILNEQQFLKNRILKMNADYQIQQYCQNQDFIGVEIEGVNKSLEILKTKFINNQFVKLFQQLISKEERIKFLSTRDIKCKQKSENLTNFILKFKKDNKNSNQFIQKQHFK